MLISYIKKGLSMAGSHSVAKPLFIAFLSILVAYYLPDLTAGIIERGMPDFPGIEQTQKIDFYEYVQLFSMMLILVFSCWTSFYGIYGLIRYTMFQKHQGKKKLILVIVTYSNFADK
jgi:hypothetical protein